MAEVAVASVKTLVDIASEIHKAVNTVQQNEEDCRMIASCAQTYCGIVQQLEQGTAITQNEILRDGLNDAKRTFERALEVVKKCQDRHIFCRFFWAKDIADELNKVLRNIQLKINQANGCGIAYNATIIPYTRAPPLPPHEEIYGFTRFRMSVLMEATNNFSDENKIGHGSSATIYKGVLRDGQEIAIKKFREDLLDGYRHNLCLDEFTFGTKLHHKNVVNILGYCIDIRVIFAEHLGTIIQAEEKKSILVLRYMPKGSLEEIVQGKHHIDWFSCFKIIQGIAQAIHYIHEQRVIHLDLKPANIMLGSNMDPVIIDFGLSKVLKLDEDEIFLQDIIGTLGFMAPELISTRVVSLKSDVHGFGITLLRTIISLDTIWKNNTTNSESGHWYSGEHWERMLAEAGGLKGLLNPALQTYQTQLTEVSRCLEVGRLCAEPNPADRPSMAEVVDMLSGKKMLPTPKKEKLVTKKVERSVTKKVERSVTKILGRSDSRT